MRSPRPTLLALLLGAAALSGCGDSGNAALYTATGRSLLSRPPDQVLEEPGVLVPDAEVQWQPYARDGWRTYTEEADGGRRFVWCTQPVARITLPALDPTDRTVEIEAFAPAATTEALGYQMAKVRLNGLPLGDIELKSWPVRFELDAPEPVWELGDNVLEIEPTDLWKAADKEWLSIALSEVAYADAASVVALDPRAGSAELADGTGLRFHVEPLHADTLLHLVGAAEDGELLVELSTLDPETGTVEPGLEFPVRPRGGVLDAPLPFPDAAGRIVQVDMRWSAGASGAALELEQAVLEEPEGVARPPVIFISIDTLAARNMSLYGYDRETTPRIAELASDGVSFTRARTNAPFTLQSYMSQFVGLYPTANTLDFKKVEGRMPLPWEKDSIAPNRWTMAEMMRAAGYRTAAWVDNPWLARGFGFEQGFDHYDRTAAEIEIHVPDGGIEHIVPRVKDWLGDLHEGEPFFLLMQALDPHGPYLPHGEFKDRFYRDSHYEFDERRVGEKQLHAYFAIPEYVARGEVPAGELPRKMDAGLLTARYDEKIAQTDFVVGEFLDWLKNEGIYDDAIIVLSADHGESILSHDFYFDHGTLYDEVLNVPLVVRLPGGEHGGGVVDTPVQLVDLLPTLAELVGVAPRAYLHGRSLVPAIEGAPLEEIPQLSEGGIMRQATVVHDGWKLIEYSPRYGSLQTMLTHPRVNPEDIVARFPEIGVGTKSTAELAEFFSTKENFQVKMALARFLEGPFHELYHVDEDPLELHDLAEAMPDKVEELLAVMAAQQQRGQDAKKNARLSATVMVMDPARLQDLEALGYIEGDDDEDD